MPSWAGRSKNGPTYRHIAICEPLRRRDLPAESRCDPSEAGRLIPWPPNAPAYAREADSGSEPSRPRSVPADSRSPPRLTTPPTQTKFPPAQRD